MQSVEVVCKTPGGREESETLSYEEFFDLLVECSASVAGVRSAIEHRFLQVEDLEYHWSEAGSFPAWAEPRLQNLPGPEPSRPCEGGRCLAVTFPYSASTEESLQMLRPNQGVSFHVGDLAEDRKSARGIGRGKLEEALWNYLTQLPGRTAPRYLGFHLGNRVDRYLLGIEMNEIVPLLSRLQESRYRPSREMADYLLYHRPRSIELIYTCQRE